MVCRGINHVLKRLGVVRESMNGVLIYTAQVGASKHCIKATAGVGVGVVMAWEPDSPTAAAASPHPRAMPDLA